MKINYINNQSFNSRQSNSDVICAEVWGSNGEKSVEDYYILGEDEVEERVEELSNYSSAPDEMKFLSFNTFELSDSGYERLLKLLKKYGNCSPGETISSLKKSVERNKPLSLNSRQLNNEVASVDIDLKHGFTVRDLTVKVEGDSIIISAKDPNGRYANESLRTKDPIYAIKTILSRVSNWK